MKRVHFDGLSSPWRSMLDRPVRPLGRRGRCPRSPPPVKITLPKVTLPKVTLPKITPPKITTVTERFSSAMMDMRLASAKDGQACPVHVPRRVRRQKQDDLCQ